MKRYACALFLKSFHEILLAVLWTKTVQLLLSEPDSSSSFSSDNFKRKQKIEKYGNLGSFQQGCQNLHFKCPDEHFEALKK